MNARANTALACCAAALALAVIAAPASAEPILDLQLTPAVAPSIPVTHSDERLAYDITMSNTAGKNPALDTELSCEGTPAEGKEWLALALPKVAELIGEKPPRRVIYLKGKMLNIIPG